MISWIWHGTHNIRIFEFRRSSAFSEQSQQQKNILEVHYALSMLCSITAMNSRKDRRLPIKNHVWKSMLTNLFLTHRGRLTLICGSKLTITGSDNGLAPGRRQAIIWTNAGILLIWHLRTPFREIWIEIHISSCKKCIWKYRLRNVGHFVLAAIC